MRPETPNKTDAGDGVKGMCRLSNVLPAPPGTALRVVFDKLGISAPLALGVATAQTCGQETESNDLR